VTTKELYLVDDTVRENEHGALRLSPHQPDLKPVDLVWGDKRRVAQECLRGKKRVFCEKYLPST
jgi:hypothetical protein